MDRKVVLTASYTSSAGYQRQRPNSDENTGAYDYPKPPIPTPPGNIATYAVTGAPLILEFEKLLLRAPVLPEGDVIFTAADLQAWADEFWDMVKERSKGRL
jgi:hypothetical protein